ncbi:MAG: hypothetical protein ACR2OV_00090 [Hyphomicrobiaceae bacterium]
MGKPLYDIAKLAAERTIEMARREGYDAKLSRSAFFVSDRLDLANDISIWLEDHMEPEPEDW